MSYLKDLFINEAKAALSSKSGGGSGGELPDYLAYKLEQNDLSFLFAGMSFDSVDAANEFAEAILNSMNLQAKEPYSLITDGMLADIEVYTQGGQQCFQANSNTNKKTFDKVPSSLKGLCLGRTNGMFSGSIITEFNDEFVTPTIGAMFSFCRKLTKVIITINESTFNPSTSCVTDSAFHSCANLTEVTIKGNRTGVNGRMYRMFYSCSNLTDINFECDIVRNTSTFSNVFDGCTNLTNLTLKNIKASLQVGSGTSWGHLLTVDSLVGLIYELRDTGSSKTLTIGSANLEKLANVYVKTIDITDEMRAEDDLIDLKVPFVVCESTDEGAMLITDYPQLKNWILK